MKLEIKTIITIPISMLVMTFTRCSSINQHDAPDTNEASSKTGEEGSHLITEEESVKFYRNKLAITGEVEFPLNFTVDSLKKMNVVTFDSLNIVCQSGAIMNQSKSSRGVLLKDVLNKAGIIQNNHTDRNLYIIAGLQTVIKQLFPGLKYSIILQVRTRTSFLKKTTSLSQEMVLWY